MKLSEAELRKLGIGALMFGSYPVQKHDGVASKIHILENTKQIFMCYTFLDGKFSMFQFQKTVYSNSFPCYNCKTYHLENQLNGRNAKIFLVNFI